MRTNIDIDDALMTAALRASGAPTKRAAVEQGLRLLVQLADQRAAIEALAGTGWQGDLDAMRQDHPAGRRQD
jgi:Arc/MetJ family transcription regulator